MKGRGLLKSVIPPVVMDWRRRILGLSARYSGHPANWEQAARMSGGYGDGHILARVAHAAREVASGRARYERDSVLFRDTNYPFAVLAALLRAAAKCGNRLEVVDFGGSLGSTYRQCRPFLEGIESIAWWVVEQPEFVALGTREFANGELKFLEHLLDVPQIPANGVLLACSVLQYMKEPSETLKEFDRVPVRHLVFDRTPMSEQMCDRLCIQHVQKSIYAASYPCWILSRKRLLVALSESWNLISDFPCPEGTASTDDGVEFEYRGLILERKS